LCNSRLEHLEVAARDQWNLGWGTIASAEDRPRSTIRERIRAARRRYADQGAWFTAQGLQLGTSEQAYAAIQTGAEFRDIIGDGE
jgi:hypothetical protein